MKLYHYTSWMQLKQILRNGSIKRTRSNLKAPVSPKMINGHMIDPTDSYKPVVWFTSMFDFDKAEEVGVGGKNCYPDKTEVAIVVDTDKFPQSFFHKWDTWAERNGIDPEWFDALKKTAPQWNTFYITEKNVPIDDSRVTIRFRPDIQEQLEKEGFLE